MGDRNTHEDFDPKDTGDNAADPNDTVQPDDATPADTGDDNTPTDPKKADAQAKRNEQADSWAEKIKDGKSSLDEMPENLQWLKPDVEKRLNKKEEAPKDDEVELRIRKALKEERAAEDFNYLVEDLKESGIDSETGGRLQEAYEGLISEFPNPTASQKLKMLLAARQIVGLKDSETTIRDRRRKGMSLPPMGTKRRNTVIKNDEMTAVEKRLSGDLPPSFKV